MAEWKSDGVGGWVPVNDGARFEQLKQDVQDGKKSPADLKALETRIAGATEVAEAKERARVAEEVAEQIRIRSVLDAPKRSRVVKEKKEQANG